MRQVPSSTFRRTLGVAAVTLALACGTSTAGVRAEDLNKKHSEIRQSIQAVQSELAGDREALGAATRALVDAQQKLDDAKARYEASQKQLADARAKDAELAQRLKQEQAELEAATAAVDQARVDVDEQRSLMAQAAQTAFQGQTDLTGIAVVMEAQSTEEVMQRTQWDDTVFDATSARMGELQRVEARLAQAERDQQAVADRVAADKEAAAKAVAESERLQAQVSQQRDEVAALVQQTAKAKADAQAEMDADQARYDQLTRDEEAVARELAQTVASDLRSGMSRSDIDALIAKGVVWRNPATYPLLPSGPQRILSPQGFIRPVAASPGSPFGMRFHPIKHRWIMHRGNDWGAACGVPLYAAQSGRVVKAGPQGGFGNYVIINHGVIRGKSVMTGYAHQSRMAVKVGQYVRQGQLIGYVGTTGLSTGCHLHLQVYVNGSVVNPLTWIP